MWANSNGSGVYYLFSLFAVCMAMSLQSACRSWFCNRIFLHTQEVTRVGFLALCLDIIDASLCLWARYAHTRATQWSPGLKKDYRKQSISRKIAGCFRIRLINFSSPLLRQTLHTRHASLSRFSLKAYTHLRLVVRNPCEKSAIFLKSCFVSMFPLLFPFVRLWYSCRPIPLSDLPHFSVLQSHSILPCYHISQLSCLQMQA